MTAVRADTAPTVATGSASAMPPTITTAGAAEVALFVRRLIFYDDARTFGGHELMTLKLVTYLAAQNRYDITFVVSELNTELQQRLSAVQPAIRVLSTSYHSGRGQWLRSYLSPASLLQLCRLFKRSGAELLIVVQGGIALSSLGLLAGRLAGLRVLTYLPMTHDESLFARTALQAALRQALVRPFYGLPHCLVTISGRMARYAHQRRSGAICVVENGIEFPALHADGSHPRVDTRMRLRSQLGVLESERLLLMMGRIEFGQKRHDLAVQALAKARSEGARLHLLVVGSGPDEAALREQVQALGLNRVVHWRAWQSEVSDFYAACDVLLLPSRYEGVPLVMLEAMHAGRKILASKVDGMADMLPPAWTFAPGASPGDATADVARLARLLCEPDAQADAEHLRLHQQQVLLQHSIEAFGQRFAQVIDHEWSQVLAEQGHGVMSRP